MASLGPWSSCLSQDLGPWSSTPLGADRQNAAPQNKGQVAPNLGPWSACLLGTPKESRSQSRSQGVDDSQGVDGSQPLGPWSEASQKGQAASQGVVESKPLRGQSAQQKRTATSDQSTPPKKVQRVDLTQACVIDIPNHVRGQSVPVSKKV